MDSITPEYAIKRAQWFIVLPTLFIFIGSVMLGLYLMQQHKEAPFLYLAIPPIAAIAVMWAYWSYAVIKWKLWAYARVDDIITLKEQAVTAKVIYADGSFWNKTEFKTAAIVAQIKELERQAYKRFEENGVQDDPTIGEQVAVYYSKAGTYTFLVMAILFFGVGIWAWMDDSFVSTPKGKLIKYIAIPCAVWFGYDFYKRFKLRNEPQILFTNFGLYLYKTGEKFYPWNEVYHLYFRNIGNTRYAEFSVGNESIESVEFEYDFTIPESQMRYLYRIYQNRFKKNNPELFTYLEENDWTLEED